jgi:hypothetical protein
MRLLSGLTLIIQLPELMPLRSKHDHGRDDIFIIVTHMKHAEIGAATEYNQVRMPIYTRLEVKQDTERLSRKPTIDVTLICLHSTLLALLR